MGKETPVLPLIYDLILWFSPKFAQFPQKIQIYLGRSHAVLGVALSLGGFRPGGRRSNPDPSGEESLTITNAAV